MQPSQFSIHEIGGVLRRRAKLLAIPPVVVTLLAVGAAFKLPQMFESSATILVQPNEVKNPLASMNNTMTVDDDPLRYIDEIVFSRSTLRVLMDSLKIPAAAFTEPELREYLDVLKSNIRIVHNGRESFVISFTNADPGRAQEGANALTAIFIQSTSATNNERNAVTVQFYQQKLEEFRQKLEQSQEQILPKLRDQAQENPATNAYLSDLAQQIRQSEAKIRDYRSNIASLQALPAILTAKEGRDQLFEMSRLDIPYASDLKTLIPRFDDVLSRYTAQHPEVAKVTNSITEILDRMAVGVRSEIEKEGTRQIELRRRQTQILSEIVPATQRVAQDKESNVLIYQRLYDGMKLKLEEAQVQQAIGQNENNQFRIIDPALRPLRPTKPNRPAIVAGGFAVGILLGLVLSVLAELFDSTVRSTRAIEVYHKPIIALLPDWTKPQD